MEPSSGSTPRCASGCAVVWAGVRYLARVSPTLSRPRALGWAASSEDTTATRRFEEGSVICSWTPRAWCSRPRYTARRSPTRGRPQAPTPVGTERSLAPQAPVAGCAGYEGRGRRWAEEAMGPSVEVVRKPPKPVPEEVAELWAREWAKEGKKIDWQRLMAPRGGYVALPRRWVVERTFSWLSQNRRLSKDYERLCASAEAFSSTPR